MSKAASEVRDGSETPQWLFDLLDREVKEKSGHGFGLDAAASHWNAKCAHYFDQEHDAVMQDWPAFRTIWCNPPFSAEVISRFTAKAIEAAEKGSTVVLLLPNWQGYSWYQEVKRRAEMRDVIGPVSFRHHDGGHAVLNKGRNSVGLVVALLGPHFAPGTNGPPIRRPGGPEPSSEARPPEGRPSSSCRLAKFVTLSDLTPQATEWLWRLRIPRGELTVLEGDPGVNKSSALLDVAARVSTGREMPDGTPGVLGGVLLLLGEDSIRKTILRRLQAAGADLERMAIPKRPVTLPRDLATIQEAASLVDARLLVIDPLMAFLGCDSNSDQKVRGALTPLKEFAEGSDVAVVMVRHLNKRGGRHALYRGGGSIGIVAATRSALLVGRPPGEPDLRVMCQTKSNLGPLAPSLCYEPVSGDDDMVRIEWRGECEWTPEDLLAATSPGVGRLGEALAFLKETLSQGPAPQQSLKSAAVVAGLAWRTVERAKEVLGVTSERRGWGPGSTCLWRLPPEADDSVSP